MEQELEDWLKQYPVPIMVTSFDAKDDVIQVSNEDGAHLVGYINQQTDQIVKHWNLVNELPKEQMELEYLARVYERLPLRRQEVVRLEALRKARATGRAIRFLMFFVVGIPVLIEIVSLGVDWIGYLLSAISISVGLYKFGKAMGWIKPTKRAQLEAEKNNKMEHYYYHCEKNPEAFLRLKIENFEREAIERNLQEAEAIRMASGN